MPTISFIILVAVGMIVAVIFIKLASLPGVTARARNHPQADAINVLGWIGVITLGLAWPLALIWAYTRSGEQQTAYLGERVATLEAELATLKAQGGAA